MDILHLAGQLLVEQLDCEQQDVMRASSALGELISESAEDGGGLSSFIMLHLRNKGANWYSAGEVRKVLTDSFGIRAINRFSHLLELSPPKALDALVVVMPEIVAQFESNQRPSMSDRNGVMRAVNVFTSDITRWAGPAA